MVKIAIAGPGQVAREIIDGLLATGKHDILLLSRRDAAPEHVIEGTTWVKVDYLSPPSLVKALQGVHTVLSFFAVHQDIDNASQKALIDAAIEAGVKRIAPAEWSLANVDHLSWYDNKVKVREYLEEKNKDKKVIEYSLFQPGWFTNYLAGNFPTAKHVQTAELTLVDHERERAHVSGDLASRTTYTTVRDFVNIVVKAVDYEGEWPKRGGINGHTLSLGEEIAIGEKVRGKPYKVETLELEDLRAGVLKASWLPTLRHHSLQDTDKLEFAKLILRGMLLNTADGGATVSDEWNQIFPDYKFTTVEEFLAGVFKDA